MLQGLALNAPALGRDVTLFDRILAFALWPLACLFPSARVVPGTPWTQLSDEEEVRRRVAADPLFENGNVRLRTALSFLHVRRPST